MSPSLSLEGRRALICGASAGIGHATAFAFAERGAELTLLARRADALQSMVDPLRAAGAPAVHIATADFDDHSTLEPVLASLDVHIVVHNTGGPKPGRLEDASVDDLHHALHRHLFTAQHILRAALPTMQREGYGRFLNVLSTSVREPIPNLGVSNLTRAAMASWAKTLSHSLPPGITINNLLPGFTETGRLTSFSQVLATQQGTTPAAITQSWVDRIPEGRLAQPEEPAALLAFLASPAGAYLRGQSIAVDGGLTRSI